MQYQPLQPPYGYPIQSINTWMVPANNEELSKFEKSLRYLRRVNLFFSIWSIIGVVISAFLMIVLSETYVSEGVNAIFGLMPFLAYAIFNLVFLSKSFHKQIADNSPKCACWLLGVHLFLCLAWLIPTALFLKGLLSCLSKYGREWYCYGSSDMMYSFGVIPLLCTLALIGQPITFAMYTRRLHRGQYLVGVQGYTNQQAFHKYYVPQVAPPHQFQQQYIAPAGR